MTKFHHTTEEAEESVAFVREAATLVEIPTKLQVMKEDPDDDKFLETAQVSGATYIVSGDHHLLSLGRFAGISVIRARPFLDALSGPNE